MLKDIVHLLDSDSLSRVSIYGGCDNAIASFPDYFLNFILACFSILGEKSSVKHDLNRQNKIQQDQLLISEITNINLRKNKKENHDRETVGVLPLLLDGEGDMERRKQEHEWDFNKDQDSVLVT